MSILLGKKVKIFSLSANKELATEIADSVGVALSSCDVLHFADGEVNVQINETVRGHHVFVIQPTSAPVNDHLMELLIMCDGNCINSLNYIVKHDETFTLCPKIYGG